MHALEIRLAAPNDLTPLCGLYEEFYAFNAGLQPRYYRAGEERGAYPQSTIESETADIFIACEDGRVLGFVHVREAHTPPYEAIRPHRYAEIVDLFTSVAHRKRGIASKLMIAAKHWARTRTLDYIELLVLPDALGALCLYKREGFDTVSHILRCLLD